MSENERNRRDFLKTAGLATAAAAVTNWTAQSYAQIAGANDRVRTAIVGCGDRMKGALVPAFMANCHETNFQFVAVSDIWNMRREQGAAMAKLEQASQDVPVSYFGSVNGDPYQDLVSSFMGKAMSMQAATHPSTHPATSGL